MIEELREVSIQEINYFIDDWCRGVSSDKCRLFALDFTTSGRMVWIAVDNRTSECWEEVFKTKSEAIDWLEDREDD